MINQRYSGQIRMLSTTRKIPCAGGKRHRSVTKCVDMSRQMRTKTAIDALTALAQPTRLAAFRLLVQHEPDGLSAGELARLLKVPHNTLSTHLAILNRAGLVSVERQSRNMIYRMDLPTMRRLIQFLMRDCCKGEAAPCAEALSWTDN